MTESAAPGWYHDPFGAPAVRWWDGAAWTEHTADAVIGSVTETAGRRGLRLFGGKESQRYELRDAAGAPFLVLNRGATVTVARPDGTPLGEIVQQQDGFDLVANGQLVGHLRASAVLDRTGAEAGRIAQGPGGGWYARFHHPLPEPLRSLALAASV